MRRIIIRVFRPEYNGTKRRRTLHERRQERLPRPAKRKRAPNKGVLDEAILVQIGDQGNPDETSSATIVEKTDQDETEEDWDAQASFTVTEEPELTSSELANYRSINARLRQSEETEEQALNTVFSFENINYNQDWIVDSRCSNI
ncbi:hypothetical protein AMTR_s00056p00132630 [Amborella trichopoda]|uniref:Uncharacterized protein n=1 Tax=Amborella trichopoda TaxID=13333 RepID=U5CPR0_AMBTC|nr:hypothetical protein AMTR_s00056p00132630 [Amborella trichopoda]